MPVEVAAFGFGAAQLFVGLTWDSKVLIDGSVEELDLKNAVFVVVGHGGQRRRVDCD
jgi:hypothetical protein